MRFLEQWVSRDLHGHLVRDRMASFRQRLQFVCPPMKVVFFDAVGTLIRLQQSVGETYSRIAQRHGLTIPPETLESAFRLEWPRMATPVHEGPSPDDDRGWWKTLVARVFNSAGATVEVNDHLFGELYDHFAKPEAWQLFPDVLPTLERLATQYRLFVLSNFDQRLRRILAGHGLDRWFEDMIISSESGTSKPDERIFRIALQRAGADADECLHVGDDLQADGEGSRRAGIQFYHVQRPERGLDRILL